MPDPLAGLSAAQKKKVKAIIKEEKAAAMLVADKEHIKFYEGLSSVRKDIDVLIAEARKSGKIPKNTTLAKLLKMPAVKPKNIGNFVRKTFSRSAAAAPKKEKKKKAKKSLNPWKNNPAAKK